MGDINRMLDEELIKKEVEIKMLESDAMQTVEIMSNLKERQKNQKSTETFIEEMSTGIVELNQKPYKVENRIFFEEGITCITFPEDVELCNVHDQIAIINYRELEFSLNIYYAKTKMNPMPVDEYQKQLAEQAHTCEMPYEPIESGEIQSGQRTVIYGSGITNSKEGYLFVMSFYGPFNNGIVGSFTCRLRNRFPYENLFKAILAHLYM